MVAYFENRIYSKIIKEKSIAANKFKIKPKNSSIVLIVSTLTLKVAPLKALKVS